MIPKRGPLKMKITSQSENEASNFFVILQSRYSLPKEISGMFMFSLRQCSGEKSIFFNNATNELLFGRKHCFYDLNIKMVHFCTFIMRLLWKLGKIAAILDSRRRKKRSQFWIFCYQIFNISKKLQYLQTYQRDFWNFEKKSIFLIFCQKWHKNMRFFIVFRIPFRN